jgi:hypothetical protein
MSPFVRANGPALSPAKSAGRKQRAAALITFIMHPTKQVYADNQIKYSPTNEVLKS